MAWTDPRTWVTSELVTAAQMNTHVRDNFNEAFRAIDRSNTVVDITNTVTPLSLFDGAAHTGLTGWTIPASVMGASRGMRVTVTGDVLYANNDADNCSLYLYVANTLIATVGSALTNSPMFAIGSPSGTREGWRCTAEVWNLAANSQIGTLGYMNAARGYNVLATGATLGSADTTAAWKLDIVAAWTNTSTALSLRRRHCVLELI